MYFEPLQASKVELFAYTVNSLKPLTIFAKSSILDICSGSKYASDIFHVDSYPNNKNGFLFNFDSCSIPIANLQLFLMKNIIRTLPRFSLQQLMGCFHIAVIIAESSNCDYFLFSNNWEWMSELLDHINHKI